MFFRKKDCLFLQELIKELSKEIDFVIGQSISESDARIFGSILCAMVGDKVSHLISDMNDISKKNKLKN